MNPIEQLKMRLCPKCRNELDNLSDPVQRIYFKAYEELGDRKKMLEAFGVLFASLCYNLDLDYDDVHDFIDDLITEIDSKESGKGRQLEESIVGGEKDGQ